MPSPQRADSQVGRQAFGSFPLAAPSPHASFASTTPSPQLGSAQVARQASGASP